MMHVTVFCYDDVSGQWCQIKCPTSLGISCSEGEKSKKSREAEINREPNQSKKKRKLTNENTQDGT